MQEPLTKADLLAAKVDITKSCDDVSKTIDDVLYRLTWKFAAMMSIAAIVIILAIRYFR